MSIDLAGRILQHQKINSNDDEVVDGMSSLAIGGDREAVCYSCALMRELTSRVVGHCDTMARLTKSKVTSQVYWFVSSALRVQAIAAIDFKPRQEVRFKAEVEYLWPPSYHQG